MRTCPRGPRGCYFCEENILHGNIKRGVPYLAKQDRHSLPQEFKLRLVDHVAAVLKCGEPTHFAFESACRHGLRAQFCKAGWNWEIADLTASQIVSAALARIGARRPTWEQGQPEYVQFGVVLVERTRCLNCGGKLPEGNRKFCCSRCKHSFEWSLADEDERKANAAQVAAYRAAHKLNAEPRDCACCGLPFKPSKPTQLYCSRKCSNTVNSEKSPWHPPKRSTGIDAANTAARSSPMKPTGGVISVPGDVRTHISMALPDRPEPRHVRG